MPPQVSTRHINTDAKQVLYCKVSDCRSYDQIMLALLVRNSRIIQGTGMSFAVLGTTMHALNVANIMPPSLSHTWSAIAILGFVLTASSQIRCSLVGSMSRVKRVGKTAPTNERNDVALP